MNAFFRPVVVRKISSEPVLLTVSWCVVTMLAAFVIAPDLITSKSPITLDIVNRLKPPSLVNPFGTDEGGRDILSRIIHGTRYSLGVAMLVVAAGAAFGVAYGAVSGMARPWVDNVLMRIVDVFFGFPALVLALTVAAAIGRGLFSVALALGLIWWPGFARLVRGEVMRIKELPHVEAARSIGVPPGTLVWRHMLPFLFQEVNVRFTTDIGYALVAVTALSFLGLGAQSPTPEWGLLIRDSRNYFGGAWWYLAFPGLMIMVTTAALSIIGDSLGPDRRSGRR